MRTNSRIVSLLNVYVSFSVLFSGLAPTLYFQQVRWANCKISYSVTIYPRRYLFSDTGGKWKRLRNKPASGVLLLRRPIPRRPASLLHHMVAIHRNAFRLVLFPPLIKVTHSFAIKSNANNRSAIISACRSVINFPHLDIRRPDTPRATRISLTVFQLYQLLTDPRHIPPAPIAGLVHDVVYGGTEAKLLPPFIYHHVDLHLFRRHKYTTPVYRSPK